MVRGAIRGWDGMNERPCSAKKHSQCGQNQHDGEVDLDDHGDVLVGEAVDHLAEEHQHASREGHLSIF